MLPEEPSAPNNDKPLIETPLEDIRQAVVSGCLTCGILYDAPLYPSCSWIAEENEESLVNFYKR